MYSDKFEGKTFSLIRREDKKLKKVKKNLSWSLKLKISLITWSFYY